MSKLFTRITKIEVTTLQTANGLVLRGTAGAFLIRGLAAIAGLSMNVLLARVLPVSEYGVISLGMSWLSIVATLACFGTDTVSVRYIAEANARGDHGQIAAVMQWGRNLTLSLGTGIGLVSCGLIYAMFSDYSGNQLLSLSIIVMATPLLALALNRASVLRGVKQVVFAASVEMLLKPVSILLLVAIVAWLSAWSPNVISVAIAVLLAHVAMTWAGVNATHALAATQGMPAPRSQKIEWLTVAKPIALMSVMGVLIGNLDTVLVGYFVSSGSAGIYRASSQLANLVSFGLVASNGIMAPVIAEYYSSGKQVELHKTLRFSVALVAFIGVGGALFMAIAGPFALHLFGAEYTAGYHALLILLAAQAINALCGPTGIMMSMTGHQAQAARIFVISALISVVLNILLIPLYGIIGAAIANAIGVAIWNISILVYLKRRLKLDPSILAWLWPMKWQQCRDDQNSLK
jgi:O-antigen/teichoic acid export membrane protein